MAGNQGDVQNEIHAVLDLEVSQQQAPIRVRSDALQFSLEICFDTNQPSVQQHW
jgi:hypothetical protein